MSIPIFPAWLLAELQSVLSRVRITWEPWDNLESLLPVFGKHYERGIDTEDVVWWRQFSKASGEPATWEKVPIDYLNEGRFVLSEDFEGRLIKKFDLIYPATPNGPLLGCPCRLVSPEFEANLVREAFHVRFDVEANVLSKIREQREKEEREARLNAIAMLMPQVESAIQGPDPSRAVVPQGFQQHESGLLIPTN
jgi:hypothetical protein